MEGRGWVFACLSENGCCLAGWMNARECGHVALMKVGTLRCSHRRLKRGRYTPTAVSRSPVRSGLSSENGTQQSQMNPPGVLSLRPQANPGHAVANEEGKVL
jgi:hypothetical protein